MTLEIKNTVRWNWRLLSNSKRSWVLKVKAKRNQKKTQFRPDSNLTYCTFLSPIIIKPQITQSHSTSLQQPTHMNEDEFWLKFIWSASLKPSQQLIFITSLSTFDIQPIQPTHPTTPHQKRKKKKKKRMDSRLKFNGFNISYLLF